MVLSALSAKPSSSSSAAALLHKRSPKFVFLQTLLTAPFLHSVSAAFYHHQHTNAGNPLLHRNRDSLNNNNHQVSHHHQANNLKMSTKSTTTTTSNNNNNNNIDKKKQKPRILCLHGKHQSGAIFSNKIGGARRKLQRVYDLHFLDGPILLNNKDNDDNDHDNADADEEEKAYAWWRKDEDTGEHFLVQEGLEYVLEHIRSQQQQQQQHQPEEPYQALIGFSQGGVVATALCCSGLVLPDIKCVVTAGSPMVPEAFQVADAMRQQTAQQQQQEHMQVQCGYQIPKLHLAGETDAMISIDSTRQLCDTGGNGRLIVHDKGHLFPTRAAHVQEILDFLEQHLLLH